MRAQDVGMLHDSRGRPRAVILVRGQQAGVLCGFPADQGNTRLQAAGKKRDVRAGGGN